MDDALNFSDPSRNLPVSREPLAHERPRMADLAERLYERLLVLRCQAGDEMAFAELVELYAPRLRYFLRKMLSGTHAVEDALQDVWLDVFRAVPRLADPAAFPAWVYRIARDRACRNLRSLRRVPRSLVESDLAEGAEDEDTFSAEDAARIHAALDELAPEQREGLVLRFLEEMTYEDIARVVGCPAGTVRSRIHYGKRALRRALERKNDHE
jgi:RNA polymerase sigma-70 factor (ECF subfamily)